jgi:hypothetical protein
MGQLLPPHRSPPHRGSQDVQVVEELHHNRRCAQHLLGTPTPLRIFAAELGGAIGLQGERDAGG